MRVDCCDAAHPCNNSAGVLLDSRGGGSATFLQQSRTRSRRCWQTPRRPGDPPSTARQKRTGTRDICIPVELGLDGTIRQHMPASAVPLLVLVSAVAPCHGDFFSAWRNPFGASREGCTPIFEKMADHHPHHPHDGGKAAEGNAEGKAGSAGGVQMCTCVRVTNERVCVCSCFVPVPRCAALLERVQQ